MKNTRKQAENCQREGCFSQAETLYRECLSETPEQPDILYALGEVCYLQNKNNEAITALVRAVRLSPDNAGYRFSLGTMLQVASRYAAATEQFQAAISLDPDNASAHLGLGKNYYDQDQYGDAIECYSRAGKLQPNDHMSWFNLALAYMRVGKADLADENLRRALARNPGSTAIHSCLLLNLHYRENITNREILDEHRLWEKMHAVRLERYSGYTTWKSGPVRRIRIGYVSPDFRRHSVAFFISPVLAGHDRTRFEVVCYSDVEHEDAVSARLRNHADGWHNVHALNDPELGEKIHTDGIDILVDLSGHTNHNRLTVFARRPAPVQVTYLGYPGTSGMTAMDVRISDQWADPEGESEQWHTERLVRLPGGFLCYEPFEMSPAVAPLPGELSGNITFGSFNNLAKVTSTVIATWSQILKEVSGARLIMKARGLDDAVVVAGLREQFLSHGVPAAQVEYVGHTPSLEQHLGLYAKVDVALDTFPYNGTTTTCEALWMGVPVITLAGTSHAGRVGSSLLFRLGLDEFITDSTAAYIKLAVEQAGQMEGLACLRSGMRKRMEDSSLTNASLFCRELEEAYSSLLS